MKLDKLGNLIVLFLMFLVHVSCDELFEKELEDQEIELYAPYNGAELEEETVTFWWNEIDDANFYQLIVVKPSFKTVEKIVLDTIIQSQKFNSVFNSGQFEWRVKAYNSVDEVISEEYSFSIKLTNE